MSAGIKNYIKIARFDHHIKQLFIVPGIVFAMLLTPEIFAFNPEFLWRLLLGFFATCAVASANYIINEWLDAAFDRFHPIKKNRPVVSSNLNPKFIILEYIVFSIAGLYLAWRAGRFVFFMESALWVMGVIYNVRPIRSKDVPYIDVISESINNAIRLLIGWFIVTEKYQPPISIVIGYWTGGAFLMATKRFSEYRMISDKTQAGLYRRSFRYYSEKSLLISAFFYALLSVFLCGIFMIKYRIELLIAIPFLCGLFCIYLYICYKPDSASQKPEKLFREKWLMVYILVFVMLVGFLTYIRLPFLEYFLEPFTNKQINWR